MPVPEPGWAAYEREPAAYFEAYRGLRFEEVHASWIDLIPSAPARVLEIGAGSGRDAAALAARGLEVLAVEPARALMELAAAASRDPKIEWLEDALPALERVRARGERFPLVLANAVWMHLAESEAGPAFDALAALASARIVIGVRVGVDRARGMREVPIEEIPILAARRGFATERITRTPDRLGRPEIEWMSFVLRRPEDAR